MMLSHLGGESLENIKHLFTYLRSFSIVLVDIHHKSTSLPTISVLIKYPEQL